MTNADRIRSSMTDEEIAEWFFRFAICPFVAIWLEEEVII